MGDAGLRLTRPRPLISAEQRRAFVTGAPSATALRPAEHSQEKYRCANPRSQIAITSLTGCAGSASYYEARGDPAYGSPASSSVRFGNVSLRRCSDVSWLRPIMARGSPAERDRRRAISGMTLGPSDANRTFLPRCVQSITGASSLSLSPAEKMFSPRLWREKRFLSKRACRIFF